MGTIEVLNLKLVYGYLSGIDRRDIMYPSSVTIDPPTLPITFKTSKNKGHPHFDYAQPKQQAAQTVQSMTD